MTCWVIVWAFYRKVHLLALEVSSFTFSCPFTLSITSITNTHLVLSLVIDTIKAQFERWRENAVGVSAIITEQTRSWLSGHVWTEAKVVLHVLFGTVSVTVRRSNFCSDYIVGVREIDPRTTFCCFVNSIAEISFFCLLASNLDNMWVINLDTEFFILALNLL